MPKVLSRAWEKFFEIQHAQLEDTNELLQKHLEDLKIISKELAEYINSPSWNRPTFYNNDEEHSIQYKEYLENSSNAITTVLPTKEPEYSLKLLSHDSISLPENESSKFDHHDDPSFPRPPPEPPDVEIFFEPVLGVLTTNVVKGISEHYVLMHNILPTLPTFDPFYLVYDTLLLFSSENKDKVFKPDLETLRTMVGCSMG
nr:hypothetical protein [Tanacetum cinerariifolium]